ncbi:MAG: hypothetical protein ABI693_28140 [Bryobacteraceae bacterium]
MPAQTAVDGAKQALLQMKLEDLNACTVELQAAIGHLGPSSGRGALSREGVNRLVREIRQTTALARGAEDWIVTELALTADPPGPGYGPPESTTGPSARILVRG